ncbi:MAG: hypothetical protein OXE99_08630 [Cellvibrionales bacterium]|nr:hypothetical protein [Cellvibrionales bacterium]
MDFITSNIINKKKATKTKAKAIETQVGSDKDNRILISQNNVDAIGELERYIESCNLKNMYCFLRYSVDLNSDTPKKFTHEKRPRSAKAYCKLLDCNEREDYKEDQEYRCLSESFFNKNIMYIKPKNDLHAELSIAYYLQSMYIKKNIDDLIEAITGTKVRCYDCARKLGANEELYGRPRIGRSFRRLTHDSKTDYLTPGNYCVETERFYTRARSTSPCKQP